MYINDVIRQVRNFYPSEYDLMEMYLWCNEVNAMLTVSERVSVQEAVLPVMDDGSVLLPEGVDMEHVTAVFCGGVQLERNVLAEFARPVMHVKGRCGFIINRDNRIRDSSVTVVYEEPYKPIRLIKYKGEVTLYPTQNKLKMYRCEFIPGDTVIISIGDADINNVQIMHAEADPDDAAAYILHTNDGALDDAAVTHSEKAVIRRYVTDKTICGAPFDTMYVDYILSKICYYQHDSNGYNQHLSSFNDKLDQYRRWLCPRLPKPDGRFRKWW